MNTQRQAFLNRVQDGLGDDRERRGAGVARKASAAALSFAAAGSLLVLGAGAAQADTSAQDNPVTVAGCSTPDAIPQTHDKWCQFINYVFDYTGQSHPSPAGGICYVFDVTIFHVPCGGTVRPGLTEACTF